LEIRKSFLSLHSRNGRENKTDEEGEKKEAKGDPGPTTTNKVFSHGNVDEYKKPNREGEAHKFF